MNAVIEIAKLVVKEIFRKKDFYIAFLITGAILAYAAQLKFYDMSNATRYLMDMGLGMSFFFAAILTVALAARQFPGELAAKTCHVLWAKPVTRGQFIVGKFLGSYAAGLACFTLFFVAMTAVTLFKTQSVAWVTAFQTYYLFSLSLMMLTALAGSMSYFFSTAITVTMTLFLYGLISVYGFYARESASRLEGPARWVLDAVYNLAPHFEFFDMRQRFIHSDSPVGWGLVLFLTAYAAGYSAFYLWVGWLRLKERVVS